MAFDSARGEIVLFGGGQDTFSVYADTWTWDGATWTLRAAPGPSARAYHAMTFDAARGCVVLFGGAGPNQNSRGDTWEWDGASWSQRATTGPEARWSHTLVYDPLRMVSVLAGGVAGKNTCGRGTEARGRSERPVLPPIAMARPPRSTRGAAK